MGWSIGYDSKHNRDVGYGVPAACDHPECDEEISRGLGYICGSDIYGGEHGCGLFFCADHLQLVEVDGEGVSLCERCAEGMDEFEPKPDVLEWVEFKLTDESWNAWREANGPLRQAMLERVENG